MMGHPAAGSFVSARHLIELRVLWFSVGLAVGSWVMAMAHMLVAYR